MGQAFDVIIVGAGPAGSSAAYSLARDGMNVLLIERGEFPGAKNMFGGRIYCEPIAKLFPKFWEEAPVERIITNETISFSSDDNVVSLKVNSQMARNGMPNSFTVLRSKFDKWMAEEARKAGATLVSESLVEELIWEKEKVVGVRVGRGQGEVFADVVVIAEGANNLLTEKWDEKINSKTKNVSVGVKEIIELSKNDIETRFNLTGNNGSACLYVLEIDGAGCGGFIYTNKASLSVGIVIHMTELKKTESSPTELLDLFKKKPFIRALIKEGKCKEISSRIIPEGGFKSLGSLYGNGVLVAGTAAGFVINNGRTLRGVDLAVRSGIAAGRAVKEAKKKGDLSRKGLASYEKYLREESVLMDMRTFKNAPGVISDRYVFETMPKIANRTAEKLFSVGQNSQRKGLSLLVESIKEKSSLMAFLKFLFRIGKSI